MINIFETSFEARERRFQIEKLYHGETVDLVGVVTTNGVPQNIMGYSVSGVFQPTSAQGSDDFYDLSADIVDNKVVVHWEKGKDFGENSYMVWALLTDGDNASYPIVWRLDMAYSPNFPLSALAPIPKSIDFSKYDLLNAPWLELSAFDEFVDGLSNEYLPLSGGVVSGDFEVKDFLKGANRSLVIGKNNVQQYSDRGVALGTNLSTNVAAVAIGDNTRAGNSSIAIGQSSEAGDGSGIVIGNNSKTYSNSIAIGAHTSANYSQSIAIGNEASTTKTYEVRLGGPYQSQYGQPSLYVHDIPILSGSDHRIPKERLPYLSEYATKEFVQSEISDFVTEDALTGLATKEELTAYAQLSDLENIDVGEMSACLSSAEFSAITELANDGSASLSSIVDKLDEVIRALKRSTPTPPVPPAPTKTKFYFSDSTVVEEDIVGEMDNRYANNATLTKVELGTHVTSIGARAFAECDALTALTIPNSVTQIGARILNGADGNGGKMHLIIPSTVTSVGEGTFSDCYNLASVTFENELTTITNSMFWSTKYLTNIKFTSASLSNAESYAFGGVSSKALSVDFTELTSVPSINQNKFPNWTRFLVASAYYNDFINASNFSAASNRIIAV